MRVGGKSRTDFEAISRRSVKRDFYMEQINVRHKKVPENEYSRKITLPKEPKVPQEGEELRVSHISEQCMYCKYARYFIGKQLRLNRKTGPFDSTTGWYSFVYDEDRKALNSAAGWSDNKKEYLLERPKFK